MKTAIVTMTGRPAPDQSSPRWREAFCEGLGREVCILERGYLSDRRLRRGIDAAPFTVKRGLWRSE